MIGALARSPRTFLGSICGRLVAGSALVLCVKIV
jgi:hypothetical protein